MRYYRNTLFVGLCLDNGVTKRIFVRKDLKGLLLFIVLFHEGIHYLNPFEYVDEIYDRLSIINLIVKTLEETGKLKPYSSKPR
jgi:hypothetical protein